jgi:hypothetical protein
LISLMIFALHRTSSSRRRAAAAVLLAAASACGGQAQPAAGPAPAPAPRPATSVAAMQLAGQKILVLPMQVASGVGQPRDAITREILFALGERDAATQWIEPDRLRSSLRRSPGYAADPDALPSDAFRHHQERYVMEPLAGLLRRYSALMDVRLVLIPQSATWLPSPDGTGGVVRLAATMVDTRSANVVWWGEADGAPAAAPGPAPVATAAAALAARMVVAR